MNYISNFISFASYHNQFIKSTYNFRLSLQLFNLLMVGYFYPKTTEYAALTILYFIFQYIINYILTRLETQYRPDIYHFHQYLIIVHSFLHLTLEYAFNISYIDNYEKMLKYIPGGTFSLMNNFFWANWKIRLIVLQIQIVLYKLVGISTVILTPFFILTSRWISRLVRENLAPYLSGIMIILINMLRQLIQRGIQFRIEYSGITIFSYPENVPVIMTEDQLEEVAPSRFHISRDELTEHYVEPQCIICHEDYNEEKQLYRVLPKCGHSFHCHCVDKWFFAGHQQCPTCRTSVL